MGLCTRCTLAPVCRECVAGLCVALVTLVLVTAPRGTWQSHVTKQDA